MRYHHGIKPHLPPHLIFTPRVRNVSFFPFFFFSGLVSTILSLLFFAISALSLARWLVGSLFIVCLWFDQPKVNSAPMLRWGAGGVAKCVAVAAIYPPRRAKDVLMSQSKANEATATAGAEDSKTAANCKKP